VGDKIQVHIKVLNYISFVDPPNLSQTCGDSTLPMLYVSRHYFVRKDGIIDNHNHYHGGN